MILTNTWLLLLFFSSATFIIVTADSEHLKEMRFKFWLYSEQQECYHELLENGTSIYFMYEILNAQTHDSSIIAYIRNAKNGSIAAISTTPQRGHLQLIANETMLIDICMSHGRADSVAKFISVFFHVYHLGNILESIKEIQSFDNSSISAHNALDAISHHVIVTRESQIEMQMLNQKDLYLIEQNLEWVNRWAIIHIILIISCSLFQTLFIRRLFRTPTTMRRMKS